MKRWQQFIYGVQQDAKLYGYMLLVFSLLRLLFIAIMYQYANAPLTIIDIGEMLYHGLRLSLKSAGVIAALSWLVVTLGGGCLLNRQLNQLRLWLGYIYLGVLAILFQARIPYYKEFHIGFNQFIFNSFNDDLEALFWTLVQQYQMPFRLVAACGMAWLFALGLKRLLRSKTWSWPRLSGRVTDGVSRISLVLAVCTFILFARFGGSLTYAHSFHWENCGVMRDEFLNETILDDVQAMYRAYSLQQRMQEGKQWAVAPQVMKTYAAQLAGQSLASNQLSDYLRKTTQGPQLPKPKHIFIILGESYAQWPLLEQYRDVPIANGVKQLRDSAQGTAVTAFLPQGPFTPMCVTGVVSGLANTELYLNYEKRSYQEPYLTALAPQFKKLGYTTHFWYGGFSSWERIKDFCLAQGFDQFHSYGDIPAGGGNVWGSDDKELFNQVRDGWNADEPSLHVILTVSNHAPYTIDLAKEGFDAATIPEPYRSNKDLLERLGHFWYADKMISEFIGDMNRKHPDSLFVVTGDHGDRTNLEAAPGWFVRYSVPFVLYGQGVHKQLFAENVAGGHIQIAPTLFELIAPPGFTYYSVGESMTRGNTVAVNHLFWLTPTALGKLAGNEAQLQNGLPAAATNLPDERQTAEIEAMRAVSWWLVKKGPTIE